MRGTVLQYNDHSGSGFISGDDGIRYTFRRSDLQQLRPISSGMMVDFVPKDGAAAEIYIIDASGAIAGTAAPAGGGFGGGYAPVAPAAPADASAYTGEDLSVLGYFMKVMANSLNGEGRARRKEFWSFVLFYSLTWFVVYFLLMFTAPEAFLNFYRAVGYGYSGANPYEALEALGIWGLLVAILTLVFLPATVTVTIRRLHDISMSGWMILIGLIPAVGFLFLFVCNLIPSQTNVNRHGPIPKPKPTVYGG